MAWLKKGFVAALCISQAGVVSFSGKVLACNQLFYIQFHIWRPVAFKHFLTFYLLIIIHGVN